MEGKLGKLAVEIAEETAEELNLQDDEHGSVQDVFTSMMKNPGKLMGIANKIGSKLEIVTIFLPALFAIFCNPHRRHVCEENA